MHYWFIFCDGKLLLKHSRQGIEALPSSNEAPCPMGLSAKEFQFDASLGFTARSFYADLPDNIVGYEWVPLRQCFERLGTELYNIAGKCEELTHFDGHTQYCSHCGEKLEELTPISKVCPSCHNEYWPQLSVAVIVLIRKGHEALLVRSKNFRKHFFGLVAGFVETGETLEEALCREVYEETGLRVCNVRYHYSQPWPYPSGLMVGFFADYASGQLSIDQGELVEGGWFDTNHLPTLPDQLSIARRLIEEWRTEEQKQTKKA